MGLKSIVHLGHSQTKFSFHFNRSLSALFFSTASRMLLCMVSKAYLALSLLLRASSLTSLINASDCASVGSSSDIKLYVISTTGCCSPFPKMVALIFILI
ncbi:hypothetical protein Barb4_01689 [Bacteroidales bacterium Barb4]|nr:hypothetical protein Barb4_01689 [Bacteroidales bacterium Barb4]